MRLDISGKFVVNVVTPNGGWSKGRPITLIEDGDKWRLADLLIPNGLTDCTLETFRLLLPRIGRLPKLSGCCWNNERMWDN